jgi:phage FluMu protein Com
MKICTEWEEIEYIEATCPHCRVIDTYHYPAWEGTKIICQNKKCKKRFKLGERE